MAETGARVYWQDMAASQERIEADRAKNAELGAILND
jgi:2-polyprenyl-3-methyl-5-hydroxy-6-metoxy-1,4-benzoquinol methylase